MSASPWLEVVAAVIERPDGAFLLAQRPAGKVYAGYWEFPGGKVELGESNLDSLRRELAEELGIDVVIAHPWITRTFEYPHASVRLNFFRVVRWRGQPKGLEGQRIVWQYIDAIDVEPMLPANGPILKALSLPKVYAITPGNVVLAETFKKQLGHAVAGDVMMIQLREKEMVLEELRDLGSWLVSSRQEGKGLLLVNVDCAHGEGPKIASAIGADGLQLSSRMLDRLIERPKFNWVGASCHDAHELGKAVSVGADFVVLGPVFRTESHPDSEPMGWDRFGELVRHYPLPVFAIGGMQKSALETARTHGAHGIAMLRAAWQFSRN
jgi:8-oxo-dGTP diphosphatase